MEQILKVTKLKQNPIAVKIVIYPTIEPTQSRFISSRILFSEMRVKCCVKMRVILNSL